MPNLECSEHLLVTTQNQFGKVHNCTRCPYFSKSINFIRNHLRRHRSETIKFNCEANILEPYFCEDCGLTTHQLILFKQHIENVHRSCYNEGQDLMEVHLSDLRADKLLSFKNYVCENCPFQTYSSLHYLQHSIDSCQTRSELFHYDRYFYNTIYLFTTSDVGPRAEEFKCDKCSYKATIRGNLKRHILHVHTSESDAQWFHCEECGYKSRRKYVVARHKVAKHEPSASSRLQFKCDKCSYETTESCLLFKHSVYRHSSEVEAGRANVNLNVFS